MKKFFAIMISVVMLFSIGIPTAAQEASLSEDIVILYTNDVHTYIDKALSYDTIAAIKEDLQKQYKYVFLVDAGDHIQGTAYGSMDKGSNMIEMMNEAGYDVATLGNHEFDYDMEGCMNAIAMANFPYVSANFYREVNGERTENVLEGYVMFDCGDEKIAFVGITTPETFEKSTPAYFQNENGEFIYGIAAGKDGEDLQKDVQNAIDDAKENGATLVVALGHLGVDASSMPWTSEETIANVSGLDAFIDGHSHTTILGENVTDKDGENVLLTQTGSYFDKIGIMIVNSETKEIKTDFIECENVYGEDGKTVTAKKLMSNLYDGENLISDEKVKTTKDAWIAEIDGKLGEKIGSTVVGLDNYDAEGNRLVRLSETNSGDFAADALYYLFDDMGMDVDCAIMNGGGIRNTAILGDISYKTCKNIHTFGNVACLQTVTGQQIKDALEWGARVVGTGENGGFLQVAGLTYKIDTTIENTVKESEIGTWTEGPDAYRVYDIKVYNKIANEYEALDENKTYNLAGYNYTLRNLGDGYAMFEGAVNVLDYVAEDYMVLANYVEGFENGVVDAQNSPLKEKYSNMLLNYENVSGSGRIEIKENAENKEFDNPFDDVNESDWFFESVCYVYENGLMNGVTEKKFEPMSSLTRGMLVTVLYRAEGAPEVESEASFEDVASDSYYADAVAWAKENEIVNGVTETAFSPDELVTREQMATIVFRYAKYKNVAPVGAWAIRLEYKDLEKVSQYAAEGIMFCTMKGIMNGKDNDNFAPQDELLRSEIAVTLTRLDECLK